MEYFASRDSRTDRCGKAGISTFWRKSIIAEKWTFMQKV